jgi:parallel beta-helix repeat protein
LVYFRSEILIKANVTLSTSKQVNPISNPKIKAMRLRSLFAILALSLGIHAHATDYYFSSSQGDDSRSTLEAQNPSTPWKSISKLNSWFKSLQPGDKVLFKCGDTFYGSIITTKAGTSSAPITLSSYGTGSRPVITGFITASGWTSLGNGIYESSALATGSTINMVTINHQKYAMGRYPNAGSTNGGYLTFEAHGSGYITDNENPLSSSWIGAQLMVRTTRFTLESTTITNVSGKNISYNSGFHYSLMDKFGYFVQNDIKTLDQFGEWYYNPSTKKIAVYFGSKSPSSCEVKVSAADILVTAHNDNIVLDNLNLSGANKYAVFNDWTVNNLQINNSRIVFSGIDAIALANTNNFVLQNSSIVNSNSNAVSLFHRNTNAVIKSSTIQNTGTFAGMLIPDAGGRTGLAIYGPDGITVTNNKIINTSYIGIYFNGNNNLIKNNFIDTFSTVLDDGAGIYTYGGSSNITYYNRKVIGNIVLHGIGAGAGTYSQYANYNPAEGIYLDANATNVEISNNTVAHCDAGVYIHCARGTILRQNIFYNNYVQLLFQRDWTGNAITGGVYMQNQAFSKSSSQLVLSLKSPENDFTSFGLFDSNYYCRPFNEEGMTSTNWFGTKTTLYNLAGWQSTYNKDPHTKKTPVTISDTTDIVFEYNASTFPKTIKLNGSYVGLNGTAYSGSIKLDPYSSIILLRKNGSNLASTSASKSATAAAVINTVVKGPGYVNTEATTLTVKAYPNPSSYYFNVTTQGGSSSEPMTLRVVDLSGRLVQVKTGVTTNSTLQIGQDLVPGSYILELIQGNKKVEQKVIKLSK